MDIGIGERLKALRFSIVAVSAKTTWIFVCAELSDGTEGWGEATSFGSEVAIEADLRALSAEVAESRPEVIGPVLALLDDRATSATRQVVRNAVEAALLDAVARRAGLPLAAMLGGPARQSVPVYANINRGIEDRSPAGFASAASAVVAEQGYRAIKIAPFDGYSWNRTPSRVALERGLGRIAAVREAVGEGIDLLVDCHGRLDPATARTVLRETAAQRLFWIEEPVDASCVPPEAQRALRDAAHTFGVRVAGGETICSWRDLETLLEIGGHDVILPDLRQTGVRLGLSILDRAVAGGVLASLHNPVGPVLDAISRHVAAVLPSFLILERQVGESELYKALGGNVPVGAGCVELGSGTGIGMRPDPQALAKAAVEAAKHRLSFSGLAGAGPDA